MTDEQAAAAQELITKLLRNMEGRRGFRRDGIDSETKAEWDAEWLQIAATALAARERAVWLEAAGMVDCVELLDPSGLTKKEQLRIYDIINKIAEMCRQQAEAVKP
jgi:hypothetical protein